MARSVIQIQKQIIQQLQANALFAAFFNPTPSQTSIWQSFTFCIAYCIAVFEQLLDGYQAFMQNLIANNFPCTIPWIQNQVLNFQYSATSPQVLQLTNFIPAYPIINASLRIITSCAVITNPTLPGFVIIKVTNNGAALNSLQLAALNSYLSIIMPPGINWSIISTTADLALIGGTVYYNGAYTQTEISANVDATLTALIGSLPFNGSIQISDIIDAVRSTTGVEDFVPTQIEMRPAAVIPSLATKLMESSKILLRLYQSYSGLLAQDTVSGRTFADTLNYVAE